MKFRDRSDAGRQLAERLTRFIGRKDTVVLGLARGGVPVAYEIARQCLLPFDVFVVRKLGVPGFEELAMGAIASGGVRVLNPEVIHNLAHASDAIEDVTAKELRELERREHELRNGRPPPDLESKYVILVDDGLATGSTMRAAVAALRQRGVAGITVAVPVGSPDTCAEFGREVDDVLCLRSPHDFMAVGQFYSDFSQTTDDEVRKLLSLPTTAAD